MEGIVKLCPEMIYDHVGRQDMQPSLLLTGKGRLVICQKYMVYRFLIPFIIALIFAYNAENDFTQ
jgi:hypothetical protein